MGRAKAFRVAASFIIGGVVVDVPMILFAGIDQPIEILGVVMLGVVLSGLIIATPELIRLRNPAYRMSQQRRGAQREMEEQKDIEESERHRAILSQHSKHTIVFFDKKKQTWSAFSFRRRWDRYKYQILFWVRGSEYVSRAMTKRLIEDTEREFSPTPGRWDQIKTRARNYWRHLT